MGAQEKIINYTASTTMRRFHRSDKFVRALMGPIGSGKSVACVEEMLIKAQIQEPDDEGYRRTKWVIVRNTYRELIDTTMKTFFDWIPKECGHFLGKDMTFTLMMPLIDNTCVHTEFLFRALDKPDDIKKLLSLDLTGGWINEAREIPKAVKDMLEGRLGRYPRKQLDIGFNGATWHGLIMDTNPPDADHWWFKVFEGNEQTGEKCPKNHELFKQPSGLSELAENRVNLPDDYYENMQSGKTQEWINVYVHGQYGFITTGKPVYPEYRDDVHYSEETYVPDRDRTIYVGIDFGLTPAALFQQQDAFGRWWCFDELVTEDMGAQNFGKLLNQKVHREYADFDIEFYGDPKGDDRAQTDEITPFQILLAQGVNAWPAYTNDPVVRREAVAAPMLRMDMAGNPGLALTSGCPIYRKALAGGYCLKRMAVTGQERFMDKPDKGKYSHVADAGQYAMLGAGEGGMLIQTTSWQEKIDYSHIDKAIL